MVHRVLSYACSGCPEGGTAVALLWAPKKVLLSQLAQTTRHANTYAMSSTQGSTSV